MENINIRKESEDTLIKIGYSVWGEKLHDYILSVMRDSLVAEGKEKIWWENIKVYNVMGCGEQTVDVRVIYAYTSNNEIVVRVNSSFKRVERRILFRLKNNINKRCGITKVSEQYDIITRGEYKRLGGINSKIKVIDNNINSKCMIIIIKHNRNTYDTNDTNDKLILLVDRKSLQKAKKRMYYKDSTRNKVDKQNIQTE